MLDADAMPLARLAKVVATGARLNNGGRRGYLAGMQPEVFTKKLRAKPMRCANSGRERDRIRALRVASPNSSGPIRAAKIRHQGLRELSFVSW